MIYKKIKLFIVLMITQLLFSYQVGDVINIIDVQKIGSNWWPIKFARELEDLILLLRTNELEVGVLTFTSEGNTDHIMNVTSIIEDNANNWLINEITGLLRRTLSRLDLSSRSIFTIVDNDSCFSGILAELLFSADRTYMLNNAMSPEGKEGPFIAISKINFSSLEMVNGLSRLATRFNNDELKLDLLRKLIGDKLNAEKAFEEELITVIPDDLDWSDEIRLSVEERTSFSPDALTGLEANLRFPGKETCETKIFGRLTAWQNWIFNRPNAVSEEGALKLFGTGTRAKFDNKRV